MKPNKQTYHKQGRGLRREWEDFFRAKRENIIVHTSVVIIRQRSVKMGKKTIAVIEEMA